MDIDTTKKNGIFYLNKNRELQFRHFEITYPVIIGIGSIEEYKSTPNEDYLIVGVIVNGVNVSDYQDAHILEEIYYTNVNRILSPIETFLSVSKRNVYFTVSDSSFRTENEPFTLRISKSNTDFY